MITTYSGERTKEENASGIAPVSTSFDDSIADKIERFREKDAEDQQQDMQKRGEKLVKRLQRQ